ncbi:MAG TPA: HD domain-containing phosphohydrolase [Vicinamibacterales bacterium]|jgi:putative nucleotidyltransferase with HDIG domain
MPGSPPRFVVRTTIATLVMIAVVLTAVFVTVAINVRDRVRGVVADKLEAGQRMLSTLEQRRARELTVQVATLAENPTLKAALDTYNAEHGSANSAFRDEMLATVTRELEKLADRISPDVLAVTDPSGHVLAAAGHRKSDWMLTTIVRPRQEGAANAYVEVNGGVFHYASAPVALQDAVIGNLQLAKALDARYAQELSSLSGAATLVVSEGSAVATTLTAPMTDQIVAYVRQNRDSSGGIVQLNRAEYAIKLLFREGDTAVYAVDSIDASTALPMQQALRAVLAIAIGSFLFASIASIWLARTISRPIDTLSTSISDMTESRDFDNPIRATGHTLEIDTLTGAFNTMMRSVVTAEAETRSAYVGAIRALALALDARDPYTAGHSERVSALSVAVGRQMGLPDDQLDILRLGALLHDIGKIGISDAVLRKPGPLTAEEFDVIQEHPAVGARILRSVPFLAPHLPIVELHHERPDGQGYPHRLRGDEIPLVARIVHVADAFDAITSARAYRPARGSADALRELWRHAGSQFDAEVVQALAAAMPAIELTTTEMARDAATQGAGHAASRLAIVGGVR